MTTFTIAVLYVLIWRICVLACGLVSVVLGYRLFSDGLAAVKSDGQLEAGIGENTIKLMNIAPGTFFALFGAGIIAVLVWTSPSEIIVPKDVAAVAGDLEVGPGGITVRGGQ